MSSKDANLISTLTPIVEKPPFIAKTRTKVASVFTEPLLRSAIGPFEEILARFCAIMGIELRVNPKKFADMLDLRNAGIIETLQARQTASDPNYHLQSYQQPIKINTSSSPTTLDTLNHQLKIPPTEAANDDANTWKEAA